MAPSAAADVSAPTPARASAPSPAPAPASSPRLAPSFLLVALLEPDVHLSLTPGVILRSTNAEIFRALPVLLVAVQRVGETPGQRRAFSDITRALRTRVTTCRAVKLRLLTLCRTPGFADFWDVRIIHRAQCYPAARASLLAALEKLDEEEEAAAAAEGATGPASPASSAAIQKSYIKSVRVGVVAEDLRGKDTAKFAAFAVNVLFGPMGVPQRDHVRRLVVRPKTFLGSELVDTLIEKVNYASREEAIEVGRRLQDMGLISKIGRLKPFADNGKLWVANSTQHSDDGVHACITDSRGRVIKCWKEAGLSPACEPFSRTQLMIACDIIDLQGVDFWTSSIFVKNPVENQLLGYRMVSHPLGGMTLSKGAFETSSEDSGEDDDEVGDLVKSSAFTSSDVSSMTLEKLMESMASNGVDSPGIVSSVKILKVFSSIASPMIVQLRSMVEGAEVGTDTGHVASDDLLLVKEGDNLGQDMCVELLFMGLNSLWANSFDFFPDPDAVPFSYAYEVFPTAAKQGFMQAVPGLTSLRDFDWDKWVETRGKDPDAVSQMVRSAAGSYIGAYIVGAADRHTENVQIQDNYTLLHIDFGFVLGDQPPIDGPHIAIYPEMHDALEKVGAWDDFVDTCENAFLAVRREASVATRMAVGIFSKFGFDAHRVREYITGPFSLNTHEPSELVASAKVRNLVKHSSQNWKTKFKSYSHDVIDPAFYSMLQARFPPAVLAMKIVDSKQSSSKKLEDQTTSSGTSLDAASASISAGDSGGRIASFAED